MSETIRTKLLVIGGGPGGYVAAIRAGQLGLDTVLVEAERLGGTCLVRGCIPSKALVHVAERFAAMRDTVSANALGIRIDAEPSMDFAQTLKWKDGIVDRLSSGVGALLRRAKVRLLHGWAIFSDAKTCTVETETGPVVVAAEYVVLATGSEPEAIPGLPFGAAVLSPTEALSLSELPKTMAVVGADYIGVELATAFRRLGVSVTLVEAREQILPRYDAELTKPVRRWLERSGVELHLGTRVSGIAEGPGGPALTTAEGARISAERVLVSAGRRPRTAGWGLERLAIDMDGPFIRVDEQCRTSMSGVWAIGDLVGEPMLAHKASAQGEMVAEIVAGTRRRFDAVVPSVCFSVPEIVQVGLAPEQAEAGGIATATGVFPFAANGRALTFDAGGEGGFIRVVARADNHRVVGIQAVGRQVAELSNQFVALMEMGAVLEDVAGMAPFHPSLGEAVREASLRALGWPLHI